MASDRQILLASFGGATVRTIMEELQARLKASFKTEIASIQPVRNRKYRTWVILSLLPGLGVKIRDTMSDLAAYDLVVLGLPKWNFNCPPVTTYIKSLVNVKEKKFVIIVNYSQGLAVDWYIESISSRIREKGGEVRAAYAVTQEQVRDALPDLLTSIQTAIKETFTSLST